MYFAYSAQICTMKVAQQRVTRMVIHV